VYLSSAQSTVNVVRLGTVILILVFVAIVKITLIQKVGMDVIVPRVRFQISLVKAGRNVDLKRVESKIT
jgi:hypothetical protein